MAEAAKPARMQVPIPKSLADEIGARAKDLDRSQRWLATELLQVVIQDRKKFCDFLTMRFVALTGRMVKAAVGKGKGNGKGKKESEAVIHLDLLVRPDDFEAIGELAEQLGHTPARMAGIMLEWGIEENGLLIQFVAPFVQALKAARGFTSKPQKVSKKAEA